MEYMRAESRRSCRWGLYILVFMITLAVYMAAIVIQGAYPFGNKSFLTYDAYVQYKNMFHMLFAWLAGEHDGTFMWNTGMGIDAYQEALYYCLSPFNILVLIMGESRLELSMVLLIVLKSSCIPVSALWYFTHTNKCNKNAQFGKGISDLIAVTCSMAYGLCGYILAYGHNIMWLDGLILMPVLAIAIERLAGEAKWTYYVVVLAVILILNFYFALYICVFAVIYFALEDFGSIRIFVHRAIRFAGASILAAMIAGAVLIPAAKVVLNSAESAGDINQQGMNMWGQAGEYISSFYPLKEIKCISMFCNNSFCGSVVIFLFSLFLISGANGVIKRLKYGIVAAVLVLALNYLPLNYVFHGFAITHGLGNRFAFVLTFLLVDAVYMILQNIQKVKMREMVCAALCALAAFAISLIDNREMSTPVGYVIFLLITVFTALMCIFWRRNSIKLHTLLGMICVIWCLEIAGNAVYNLKDKYSDSLLDDSIGLDRWSAAYDELKVENGERKTAYIGEDYSPYTETNWYSSMVNGNTIRAFGSMGIGHYDNVEYIYDGITPLTALMYNVRYSLVNEEGTYAGYSEIEGTDDYKVYEADRLAGMGFVLDEGIAEWKADGNAMENQNDFIHMGCGIDGGIFTEIDLSEGKVSHYNLDVIDSGDGYCAYRTTNAFSPITRYEFDADSDMDLYMYSRDTRNHYVEASVDGAVTVTGMPYMTEFVSHIGKVKKGQHVKISVCGETSSKTGSVGQQRFGLYSFDADLFEAAEEKITQSVMKSVHIENGSFTGSIEADRDGVLYLAYPYNDGFDIYLDGEKNAKLRLGTGNMGIRITAGLHDITITYRTPGLLTGCCVSIAGICIFIVLIGLQKKKRNGRGENYETER